MGLGREASHVAYPGPKIVAARMGPTPKIWVRVVPEASTSASMRLDSDRRSSCPASLRRVRSRSQAPSEAVRGAALGPH